MRLGRHGGSLRTGESDDYNPTGLVQQYVPVYAYEFNDENAPEFFLPPVGFP